MKTVACDYFVVGSGMAGLMSALHLAAYGKVTVVTKGRLADCNTNFAQGGICCVLDPSDTFDRHARDTMIAGAWLGRTKVVHELCEHAPEGIRDLIDCGVRFTRNDEGAFDLTREGGHSARRILHAGDITGERCEAAMIRSLRRHPEIDVREQTIVIDLIMSARIGLPGENRCVGAYVLDKGTGEIYAVQSPNTILATGGCGKVYLYTCNPDTATGDGIALAWRAGAQIENMEFIQFHPTCLYHPQAKRFLISEAVRGEDAVLGLSPRRPAGLADVEDAATDWRAVCARLETQTGIPAGDWIWKHSAAHVLACYNDLHAFARACAGGGWVRMRDELDAAAEALQAVKVAIMRRVGGGASNG